MEEEEEKASDFFRLDQDANGEHLARCFHGVLEFLQNEEGFRKYFDNVLDEECRDLSKHLDDLLQTDCGIVVSGDTSVGKSSLINKILGQKILLAKTLESTSKVYRIKYSNVYQVKMYRRGTDQPSAKVLQGVEELRQVLADIEKEENRDELIYQVDVMLPFTNLEGNVTIVDTPGTGDSEELKKLVEDYIPKAVAFVFVLDVSRAGGLQKDRVLQTLQGIHSKLELMLCFDPQDVLFVRNKWDCVDESEEEKVNLKIKLTEKIKKEWPWAVDEHIFDTILKKNLQEEFPYSSEFERFEAAILRLIRKKENIRCQKHSLFLDATISCAKSFITRRIEGVKMTTEEKKQFSKRMTGTIERLSKEIKRMQEATDANVHAILLKLASDLQAYIHSPEFKELVVNTGPKLSSFMKININREMQKRIDNAVVSWARQKAPEIIDREINRSILMDAKRIFHEIKATQLHVTDITGPFNAESISMKFFATILGGTLLSLSRYFWALFLRPQATIALTATMGVILVTGSTLELFNLTKDVETVVNDCFTTFIEPLNRDRLFKRIEKCMTRYLYYIHNTIFKEKLPRELRYLERSLEFTNMDQETLQQEEDELKSLLSTIDHFEERLSEINPSVSSREFV